MRLLMSTLVVASVALVSSASPEPARAACPSVPQPQTMDNPAFYAFVQSYRGDCATRANWDRTFDDVTVSSTTGAGDKIDVTTSTALAGAVASVKVNGQEYIA